MRSDLAQINSGNGARPGQNPGGTQRVAFSRNPQVVPETQQFLSQRKIPGPGVPFLSIPEYEVPGRDSCPQEETSADGQASIAFHKGPDFGLSEMRGCSLE